MSLNAGDEMEVLALKQRYGKESFLVARPAGSPKLVAKAALHATYEALLRGAGCADAANPSSTAWFVDVGSDDDELLALASSLGCGVSVLDPEVKDVRAVDMTRCMNEEPNRPFVVFQVAASNHTNPETLANMTNAIHEGFSAPAPPHKVSLMGLSKPAMLNGIARKRRADAEKKQAEEDKKHAEEERKHAEEDRKRAEEEMKLEEEKMANKTAEDLAAPNSTNSTSHLDDPELLESGVMLDTIFTRPVASNVSTAVLLPGDGNVSVNTISVLKVTPRSESTATLKALQGARSLLESGRVQCLVTEMNFDLNYTASFLNYVTELETLGFHFAHLGSLDYSELEVTDQGQYEVFRTDSKQLMELFDTYKRIRSFDERSGFRVYSGSLSLDRKGHYFDYTDLIFACRGSFPPRLSVLEKGTIRFRNGVWWLEKSAPSK